MFEGKLYWNLGNASLINVLLFKNGSVAIFEIQKMYVESINDGNNKSLTNKMSISRTESPLHNYPFFT